MESNLVCQTMADICKTLGVSCLEPSSLDIEKTEYINWLSQKTDLIFSLDNVNISKSWLPSITTFAYEHLQKQLLEDEFKIIRDNYIKVNKKDHDIYIIDNQKTPSYDEILLMADKIVFRKKNVVWVNFGYNIGSEFTGKHPALILRNVGDNLIVIPLSSQEPTEKKDYHVKVEKVYRLNTRIRWANIHRIIPVSIKRIDFDSPNGSVGKEVVQKISNAIQVCGIK